MVIIPPTEMATLAEFAGLVLMGGADVNPARYGAERHPGTGTPDDDRDSRELVLIGEAIARDVPLLAICRGMQILNVWHGGTLNQDIAGHKTTTPDLGLPAHSVEVEAGTRLAGMLGRRVQVNSRHHQAVQRLGSGLLVTARDPRDRVVEAVERHDRRFVVGVQWHPENKNEQLTLFQSFSCII